MLLAAGLCACAAGNAPQPPLPGPPAPLPPQQSGFEMVPPDQPSSTPGDMCGAAKMKYLVGRPKTDIPIPVDPSLRRVTCTSCPITMDFNPRRLNILYDEASGIIKEVKCG
jgi:hypothetical protein